MPGFASDKLTSGRLGSALAAGLLIVLAFATYHRSLRTPMGSDARFLTYQNEFVRDSGGLARFWVSDFFEGAETHAITYRSGYYRPITNTLFWMEYRWAGRRESWYRAFQIFLHGVNAFLVLLLCTRLTRDRWAGGVAALLFVLHPIQAFAATDPAARADVVFPVFYMLAILLFDSALGEEKRGRWIPPVALATAFYLGSILSKEMGITLPAVLTILVALHHYRDGLPWRRLLRTAPIWAAMGGYLVWRFAILRLPAPNVGYGEEYGPLTLAIGGLKGILIHITRLALPLGADYPELNPSLANFLQDPLTDPLAYAAVLIAVALVGLALLWKRNPEIAFWSGFFLITYSPLLNVDSIAGTATHQMLLTQERWVYLPAVAAFALLGVAMSHLWRQTSARRRRIVLATLGGLVLLALGTSATRHAGQARNPFARLRLLYLLPEERLGPLQRANKLMLYAQWVAVPMGDLPEAERRARAALELVPGSPITAAVLGEMLSRHGKWEEVVQLLAPWHDPSFEELNRHRQTNFRVFDDINRANPQVSFLLGQAHLQLGNTQRGSQLLCEAGARGYGASEVERAFREVPPADEPTDPPPPTPC